MKKGKLKIGIISLTSCEGCCFAVLDCPQEFLALKDKVEIKNFRLFEDDEHIINEQFAVVFVEGSPLTDANVKRLRILRKNARWLIAFGSCAAMGGIYHLKQYQDKRKIFNHIYWGVNGVENLDVRPLAELVKVDFVVPGCPITAAEFFGVIAQLIIGKPPTTIVNPICDECQLRDYQCVLLQGEMCLGPITLGGCKAICLKFKQGCWGCRGLLAEAPVDNLVRKLRENFSDKEIIKCFEVFGLKEQIASAEIKK